MIGAMHGPPHAIPWLRPTSIPGDGPNPANRLGIGPLHLGSTLHHPTSHSLRERKLTMTVNTTLPRARGPESNTGAILADLAERASTKYALSSGAWLECAHMMLEARAIAKHGQWQDFLSKAGIPERTAQRMLKVARSGLKPDILSVLGGPTPTIAFLNAMQQSMEDWRDMEETIRDFDNPDLLSDWIQNMPDGPNSAILWLRDWTHIDAILLAMVRLKIPLHESTVAWLGAAWGAGRGGK